MCKTPFFGGGAAVISKVGLFAAVLFASASDVSFGVAPSGWEIKKVGFQPRFNIKPSIPKRASYREGDTNVKPIDSKTMIVRRVAPPINTDTDSDSDSDSDSD